MKAIILVFAMLIAMAGMGYAAEMDTVVMYHSPDSVVTVTGGAKNLDEVKSSDEVSICGYYREFNIDDTTNYGNSYVRVHAYGDANRVAGFWKVTDTVNGTTRTSWLGSSPQWDSSQIRLSESWKFNGTSVSVSIPLGVGFSGSGSTVTWSGEDTSGERWSLTHIYSNVQGYSYVALWSMTKSASGSHYFQTTGTWVSAFTSTTI